MLDAAQFRADCSDFNTFTIAANSAPGAKKQLLILSRLRKMELIVKTEVEAMTIHYDIETDGLFLKGIEEGYFVGGAYLLRWYLPVITNFSGASIILGFIISSKN